MCGLEHLANCHGEWAMFGGGLTILSGGLLWWRRKYADIRFGVRMWLADRKVKAALKHDKAQSGQDSPQS